MTDWHKRTRFNRLANILYPGLADPEAQRQMAELSANEKKKSPIQAAAERRGETGKAKVVKR